MSILKRKRKNKQELKRAEDYVIVMILSGTLKPVTAIEVGVLDPNIIIR